LVWVNRVRPRTSGLRTLKADCEPLVTRARRARRRRRGAAAAPAERDQHGLGHRTHFLPQDRGSSLRRPPAAMRTSTLRHYRKRLQRSERLRYRIARLLLWAIALGLLASAVAYAIAARN